MEFVREYALSWLGVPYIFGGNSRDGIDCSGYAQAVLRCAGIDPPGDQTAQSLFDHFSQKGGWNRYSIGALAFYGKDAARITHVGVILDQYQMIEAGGGDSTTTTVDEARRRGAEVRISLIKARPDLHAVIRPSYALIGYP